MCVCVSMSMYVSRIKISDREKFLVETEVIRKLANNEFRMRFSEITIIPTTSFITTHFYVQSEEKSKRLIRYAITILEV